MTDRYEKIRKALAECRDIAMEWTMRGRIPECGKFGEIAQDLDAVCAELENSTQWHPITDAERDQLAAANARLRKVLAALIIWIPPEDTYRRLGFDPETPMQVVKEAWAAIEQEADRG